MKDILNIFLVLTLEELPLFVAPLSMDNFDMSSVIRDMETIKKGRECYLVLKDVARSRTGDAHNDMRVSRLRFKYVGYFASVSPIKR